MDKLDDTTVASCVFGEFAKTECTTLCFADHYLAYSAAGSMRLEIEERYLYLQPAKAAWIPANTTVIAQIPTGITCCSILFNPDQFPEHNPTVKTIDLTSLAQQMILHCKRWSDRTCPVDRNAQIFYRALAMVLVERMDAPTTDWVPRGHSKLVSRAVDLTIERHMNTIELGEIASVLATSERNLSRRVVDETGMKWSDLLRRVRIIAARELLVNSDIQIIQIAATVGYSSQSAFNRAFKNETGLTPRQFQVEYRSM